MTARFLLPSGVGIIATFNAAPRVLRAIANRHAQNHPEKEELCIILNGDLSLSKSSILFDVKYFHADVKYCYGTVKCGRSAVREAEFCRQNGFDSKYNVNFFLEY